MRAFYEITTAIREQLELDPFVKTVSYGDLFKMNLNKQDIYPISHMNVTSINYVGSVINFNFTITFADLVDFNKDSEVDPFVGNDNVHDVMNTQLAVLSRLLQELRKGLLADDYDLIGEPTAEPFYDKLDMMVAGWTLDFTVSVPNTEISIC